VAGFFGITLRLFERAWRFCDASVEYILSLRYLEGEGSKFHLNIFVGSEELKIPCHIAYGILVTDVSFCGNKNICISCYDASSCGI
jgi:hypothetical protein